jgi:DNA-binding LytR/AlgR family response regulator
MAPDKYNCMVVDDEPIARKIIISYIEQMPLLQLAAECINALSAIDYLRAHSNIDIIFLDINMPHLSGLQMLKIAQPQQRIIFTTAYAEYAVESYELNAADYLLKPFSFERFTKAVYKAVDFIPGAYKNSYEIADEKKPEFFIKSDGKNYPVLLDDILYCEAKKNYTMVVLKNEQKLMPLIPLSKFETALAEAGGEFVQIHRSFIISQKHITSVTPNNVTINKLEIPIGIQFKEKFFEEFLQKSLTKRQKKTRSRVLLRKGTDFHFYRIEDVAYFYSSSKLIFLIDFHGQKHLTDFKTLSLLEEELDTSIFYRVNRKFIVNINAIKKFKSLDRVKLTVELTMKVPEEIIISQENAADFKNWIASKDDLEG